MKRLLIVWCLSLAACQSDNRTTLQEHPRVIQATQDAKAQEAAGANRTTRLLLDKGLIEPARQSTELTATALPTPTAETVQRSDALAIDLEAGNSEELKSAYARLVELDKKLARLTSEYDSAKTALIQEQEQKIREAEERAKEEILKRQQDVQREQMRQLTGFGILCLIVAAACFNPWFPMKRLGMVALLFGVGSIALGNFLNRLPDWAITVSYFVACAVGLGSMIWAWRAGVWQKPPEEIKLGKIHAWLRNLFYKIFRRTPPTEIQKGDYTVPISHEAATTQ